MSDVAVRDSNGAFAKAYDRRAVSPPVDVFESAEDLLIIADVPGVPNGGIDLRVESGTLMLQAKHAARKDEHPALAREYDETTDFAATFRIPAGIDTTAISAEAKNGTLVVRLPKAAAAKPRKIAVS
jgi:HSP20 family protein